eukprot:TRINITY_DN21092_c0_g1_i1.p1 TRINITY_DN21092_c0_g1~~TRINITY_DN21092_c0_g1_i1.p1  ORF type:complete len:166 (+),score=10.89 TRINITY_DN21092_c0_g1_i1:39-536(+)
MTEVCTEVVRDALDSISTCSADDSQYPLELASCECLDGFIKATTGCSNDTLLGANVREALRFKGDRCPGHESEKWWVALIILCIMQFGIICYLGYLVWQKTKPRAQFATEGYEVVRLDSLCTSHACIDADANNYCRTCGKNRFSEANKRETAQEEPLLPQLLNIV